MKKMKLHQLLVLAVILVPAAILFIAESDSILILLLTKVGAFALFLLARACVHRWGL